MHQDTRQTIINVDAPHSGVLTSPVTFFTGWISGGPDIRELEVRINGRPHPNVSTFERPDVPPS